MSRLAERNSAYEAVAVKMLGEWIGYGNLMSWASALWRKSLADKGFPTIGALVPRIDTLNNPSAEEELYDKYVAEIFGKTEKSKLAELKEGMK